MDAASRSGGGPVTYPFRREDNGELEWVSFERMMHADAGGFLVLPDGTIARRSYVAEAVRQAVAKVKTCDAGRDQEIVSDSLGVTAHDVDAFQADARANGFSGVEFRRDPREPTFFQCVVHGGRKVWREYMRHRGYADHNGRLRSKVMLSEVDFQKAQELVSRCHPQ